MQQILKQELSKTNNSSYSLEAQIMRKKDLRGDQVKSDDSVLNHITLNL